MRALNASVAATSAARIPFSMAEWPALVEIDGGAPPWPSAWIPQDALPGLVPWLLGAFLVASVVVAAVPTWRVARVAYFVTLVQYVSLIGAFGGVSHDNHAWLWMSGILILLPDRRWTGRTTLQERRYFLNVVWLGQLMILFFYSLTGIWKIVFALHGAVTPRGSTLGPEGLGQMIFTAAELARARRRPARSRAGPRPRDLDCCTRRRGRHQAPQLVVNVWLVPRPALMR